MSGKIKITENTKGGDTTYTERPEKSKGKKWSESLLDKDDPKDMKIKSPSSKGDDYNLSSMSKFSHENEKIPRGKNKDNTRTFSQSSYSNSRSRWHGKRL